MFGWMEWTEAGARSAAGVQERRLLRARFAAVTVARGEHTPEGLLRRRVRQAARQLKRSGVKQVVVPERFPFRAELERHGLAVVDTLSLRREIGAEWTRQAMEAQGLAPGSARIAVTAAELTGETVRTVTELALRNRYVLMDVPYGGEELCRRLRRSYGVSLQLEHQKTVLDRAEVLVLFDSRQDLSQDHPLVIHLEQGREDLPELMVAPELEQQLPQGLDRGMLLTALREVGVLRTGEVTPVIRPLRP